MSQPITQVLSYARAQPLGRVAAYDLLNLQRAYPDRYPVLLQSAATAHGQQHDVLMAFPQQRLTLFEDNQLRLPDVLNTSNGKQFLPALDEWWCSERTPTQASTLPFSGGWFVFLGYELAAQIEPSLQLAYMNPVQGNRTVQANRMIAQAIRMPAAIVRDTITHEAWFVAEHDFTAQFNVVKDNLNEIRIHATPLNANDVVVKLNEEPPHIFLAAVNKAMEYIAAGDIYQANLSRCWSATLSERFSVHDIYQQLCAANPAPFAGIAILSDDEVIISSSPERLLSVRHGLVSTRPIAGTRPRSTEAQRDAQLIEELRRNVKEQAEHVMLLDLERNDLGRICKAGSVQVDEFMAVESYAHVHHIVSNVRGELRDDVTPGQAIAAVFPGGTITGCPKVKCMNIIAELEGAYRGAYTGAMGYLNRDGSMDLNILIRSLHKQGDTLSFRAGAGIVADSIAELELEETRAKALGLLRALGASC